MSGAHSTLGGTQSPPLQDSEPLGVSNMRGDKPQGVPDAKQREQYFSGTQSNSSATEVQSHLPISSADKTKKE